MADSGEEEIEIRSLSFILSSGPFVSSNRSPVDLPQRIALKVKKKFHTLTCAIMNWVLRIGTHMNRVQMRAIDCQTTLRK